MRLFDWIKGRGATAPRNAAHEGSQGFLIRSLNEFGEALGIGSETKSGQQVTPETALRVAAVYGCTRIIANPVSTLPLALKRRVDADRREDASDHPLWRVLRRRPNPWQTPDQFRRMLMLQVLLRGDAICQIQRGIKGDVRALVPLKRSNVVVSQNPDLSLKYTYTRPDGGGQTIFQQDEIFRLVGSSIDGVTAVSPLTYARESVGLSLAQEAHGAETFRNGAHIGLLVRSNARLNESARENLTSSINAYTSGGEKAGGVLVLEQTESVDKISMTPADVQWIESRKFTRSDIAMFYGVPPHMIGDTEKTTSWGSGIEQQTNAFIAYTLEQYLTMWEQAIDTFLLSDADADIYAKFNRSALVQGDLKTRTDAYAKQLQWGMITPNEARAMEDRNPREDGSGGQYYPPPNMTRDDSSDSKDTKDTPE